MQMEHTLSVDAPIADVWKALIDPERVVDCMPGASLSGVDGDSFNGQIKVKIGPVALVYKGVGTFIEKDESAHRAVLEGSAKESRGQGTAKATVTMSLKDEGDRTTGTVVTDLAITGKPAQFGRGMLSDVGGKIIEQFASCMSRKLGAPEPAAETPPQTDAAPQTGVTPPQTGTTQPASEPEALDLMQYAGGSVLKRVGPLVGAIAIGAILFVLVRRLRHH